MRSDGGIARVWATMAGRHVELREIDYAEVLRERVRRRPGRSGTRVIANCLQGSAFDLDEAGIRELLGIAVDSEQLADLMTSLESSAESRRRRRPEDGGACCGCCAASSSVVSKKQPEQLEPVLKNMAAAVGRCSPEMLLGLMGPQTDDEGAAADAGGRQPHDRHDDRALRLAARHLGRQRRPIGWRRRSRRWCATAKSSSACSRSRKDDVAASPLGSTEGFEVGVEQRRGKAADVLLRRTVRLGGVRHASCRARAAKAIEVERRQRRPAGADRAHGSARSRRPRCARST